MPSLFNDAIDDPPVFDVQDSFAGGMVSDTRANRLDANQGALLVNCDIGRDGLLLTRRGTSLLGSAMAATKVQGLIWYDSATFEYLVAVCGAATYRYTGGAWAAWSGYVPTNADALVNMVTLLDTLYFVDGASNLKSWNGAALTDLGAGGAAQPPAAPSIILGFTNRLFVSGVPSDPTSIHISSIGASPTWNTSLNVLRVGYGENDPITNMTTWDRFNVVVFKKNSTWILDADPTVDIANFPIQLLHRSIGCVGTRAACQVGQDVWFLSDSGVHSVRRTIVGDNNEVSVPISQPIQNIIDRITWVAANKSIAHFFNNRFFLSVPLDGSTELNYVLVYDTLNKAWAGYWTGLSIQCASISADGGELRLNFGRGDGKVSRWLNLEGDTLSQTYKDLGTTDIPTSVRSRGMTFQEFVSPKKPFNAAFEFHDSLANAVNISVRFDEKDSTAIVSALDSSQNGIALPQTLPFTLTGPQVKRKAYGLLHLPPFREMQIVVESASNKLALRNITASAFVNTMEIER